MQIRSCLLLVASLAVAAPADGTDGSRPPSTLDGRQAVALALANHPRLRGQRERLAEFRALRGQALSRALPQVDAGLSTVRSRDPGLLNSPNFSSLADGGDGLPGFDASFLRPIPVTLYDYRLNVEQTIYAFGRISAAVRAAATREEQIRLEIRAAEIETARQVVTALYDLALAEARLEVLAAERAAREKQVEQAEDFLDIGTGTRLSLLQARSALAALRPREIAARGEVDTARVRLNEALGRGALEPVETTGRELSDARLPELPPLDALLAAAARRPDLAALQTERKALDHEHQVWRAGLLPDLKFSGSWGISTIFTEELLNADFSSWNAGVFFEWTLFDGRQTRYKLAELRSRKRQNEWSEKTRLGEIERDLARAAAEYRRARMAADAALDSVALAEETLRVAQANHAWGAATTLDLLLGHQGLRAARFEQLTAVHDALVALADVHAMVGRLPFQPLLEEASR
ncbi:MAG: TolC family protein [Acidobacteriota bacterium]|nr:TolC family protein [Acidobacteriota bacterium]MDQ7088787.1 TolC family protein [Acidobacteriota bacterium]